jgi:hypothetical protein
MSKFNLKLFKIIAIVLFVLGAIVIPKNFAGSPTPIPKCEACKDHVDFSGSITDKSMSPTIQIVKKGDTAQYLITATSEWKLTLQCDCFEALPVPFWSITHSTSSSSSPTITFGNGIETGCEHGGFGMLYGRCARCVSSTCEWTIEVDSTETGDWTIDFEITVK